MSWQTLLAQARSNIKEIPVPARPALVPDTSRSTVTVTSPLVHRCPHKDEVDYGRITIEWNCLETTIELHSLAAYLGSWGAARISHEDLTRKIENELDALDGVEILSVRTEWKTAGMDVVVER